MMAATEADEKLIGGAFRTSHITHGIKNKSPIAKVENKKASGLKATGLKRTRMLYTPKIAAAKSIRISPSEKVRFTSRDRDPPVIRRITPKVAATSPANLRNVKGSLRKTRANTTMNTGEVTAISERFMALEV